MQKIYTEYGDYFFEPQHFSVGSKILNKDISKENLLLFREVMEKYQIQFTLAYGTLLGAIREKDFIAHDEDTDIAILEEDRNKFLNTLFDLKEIGFVVGRYENDLLSIIRHDEYIDIYIFRKALFGYRKFENEILKEKYLICTSKYSFLENDFSIPKDYIGYLEDHYGKDWKIPKVNIHACNPGIYLRFKEIIKKNSKTLFTLLSWLKRTINAKN